MFSGHVDLVEHRSGYTDRTGTFGYQLMVFDKRKDSGANLVLTDRYDFIDVLLTEGKGVFARFLDCNAVGNGQYGRQALNLIVVYALHHTGSALCLHTYDVNFRFQVLDGKRYACGQSATPDWYDNYVHVGQVIQNFHTHRTLSGDN